MTTMQFPPTDSERPECEHKNKGYCWRVIANGARRFGEQCLRCGSWYAVSTKKLHPAILDAPDYDEKIKADWDQKVGDYWEQDRIRREQEYEAKKNTFRQGLAEYYQTPEWERKRILRLRLNEKLFNGLCEMCFVGKAYHVHHFTYERLGNEWIFDLGALCKGCHLEIHPHMQD